MKPDKYRKRFHGRGVDARLRRQIATEAAKRLIALSGGADEQGRLPEVEEAAYYLAKRRAAAVLGQTVRPGELPSDSEVREQMLALWREGMEGPAEGEPDPESASSARLSDHLDRFSIYRMRLEPLEAVKQDARIHPEGDALYHSLQVFERAREARPYDEEFLLAALLHDVGKGIDPRDHVASALEALRGTLTERTAWLIAHHHDLTPRGGRPLGARERQALEESPYYEDLVLLGEVDRAGTEVGVAVPALEEALAYLRGLEAEEYLQGAADHSKPAADQDGAEEARP
jgi:predicted HD phosphohydrolase